MLSEKSVFYIYHPNKELFLYLKCLFKLIGKRGLAPQEMGETLELLEISQVQKNLIYLKQHWQKSAKSLKILSWKVKAQQHNRSIRFFWQTSAVIGEDCGHSSTIVLEF